MITYPLSNRDALRVVMARVPAAGVKFRDPVVQQFFDDEAAGLCEIQVQRLNQAELDSEIQHQIQVQYLDPERAMIVRLSI